MKIMAKVPDELRKLQTWPEFRKYHKTCADFSDQLERFLGATMDEVRTSTSNKVVRSILQIIEMSDFGLFRKSVLRRELSGVIAYPRQRDHSAHTLYNYLLGWYFFRHARALRDPLDKQFKLRGVDGRNSQGERWEFFGHIWQYASLLHDIGYMFEGGLPSLGFRDSIEQAEIGVQTVRDYFHRQVWVNCGFDGSLRDSLLSVLDNPIKIPAVEKCSSLGDIAAQLQHIGDPTILSESVSKGVDDLGLPSARRPAFGAFSCDAFELWAHHYDVFKNERMSKRIRSVREIFHSLIDEGLPRVDLRLLDHGVCSGLLLLLASTFYYQVHTSAQQKAPVSELAERFVNSGTIDPAFWWTGIVWATAATAIHNVQQMADLDKLDEDWPGPLNLDEDPLAYLGILVDIIQEWDRYSVRKVLDGEPIQGNEVELGENSGIVEVCFLGPEGKGRAGKVERELKASLSDWQKLLRITFEAAS
jgi:hypothetical protein